MIDKILSMFGLVRCAEHNGEMFDISGTPLFATRGFNSDAYYNYVYTDNGSGRLWTRYNRKIVRKSTLALNQAMRCL